MNYKREIIKLIENINEEKEKLISICKEIGGRIFLPNEIKGLEIIANYTLNVSNDNAINEFIIKDSPPNFKFL